MVVNAGALLRLWVAGMCLFASPGPSLASLGASSSTAPTSMSSAGAAGASTTGDSVRVESSSEESSSSPHLLRRILPPNCDVDGDGYLKSGGGCGGDDCDDKDNNVNPAAPEICDDGIDNDCDGVVDNGCGTGGGGAKICGTGSQAEFLGEPCSTDADCGQVCSENSDAAFRGQPCASNSDCPPNSGPPSRKGTCVPIAGTCVPDPNPPTTAPASCVGVPEYGTFADSAVPLKFETRGEWGANPWNCGSECPIPMDPSVITVHHTATPLSTTPSSIQNYHQGTNGWCDIGYNFLIDETGTIYQGRPFWDDADFDTAPETSPNGQWPTMALVQGTHAGGVNNVNNIGISLIGCFHDGPGCANLNSLTTTDPQYVALVQLIAYLADLYGIAISSNTVNPHSEYNSNTVCPGSVVQGLLPTIITDAAAIVDKACSVPHSVVGGEDIRGTCLPQAECGADAADHRVGTANSAACPTSGDVCCHDGSCSAAVNFPGRCTPSSDCPGDSWSVASTDCPASPAGVECCARETCESSNSGATGTCIDETDCQNAGGTTEGGLCPGPANVKCCLHQTKCSSGGQQGLCLHEASCGGSTQTGLCPGPAEIKCCFA